MSTKPTSGPTAEAKNPPESSDVGRLLTPDEIEALRAESRRASAEIAALIAAQSTEPGTKTPAPRAPD